MLDLRRAGLIWRASKLVDRPTTRLLALGVPIFWLTHRGRSGFSVSNIRASDKSAKMATRYGDRT
ncbi:hypothetical protein QUA20_16215 [Microcoleus sp. Pol7_A1]|uniref:hypothetical protein n=1 Tax=Microcoleus sp. Pol7_A1 TaxID=2818893 RepID=UPI002FD642AE